MKRITGVHKGLQDKVFSTSYTLVNLKVLKKKKSMTDFINRGIN